MWITTGYIAYNTEQFEKITIRDDNVVGCVNGSDIILKHVVNDEDAKRIFTLIMSSIESGKRRIFL